MRRSCGARSSGFVACAPATRSRALPMFTRIPVISIESTRFVRPNHTNGSVSPVVGSSPITTPMCRNAVLTVVVVSPIARSCWNGVRACLRDAEPEPAVEREEQRHASDAHEAPLLADAAADEVVVREREEAELLPPLAEPDAEPAARADGDERLLELVVRPRRAPRRD